MTILIGKCMNCGKVYGNKVAGTLESIYNLEVTSARERVSNGQDGYVGRDEMSGV